MKCESCKKEIQKTFLGKIVGTMVRVEGKKTYLCNICQQIKSKE